VQDQDDSSRFVSEFSAGLTTRALLVQGQPAGVMALVQKLLKRSIVVSGRRTSISLEEAFAEALREIAAERGDTMSALVSTIDAGRTRSNLSSAIRVFVLHHFRAQADAGKSPTPTRTRRVDLRKSLARNLRRLRVARGLSQTELAAKAGIARPHLCRLENRTYDTSLNTVSKLAAALRCEPVDLLK
jgi:predicted DNA-binding ribbon-helix-helix protein/DNA-binding XRE family transcriptional regulator